MAMMLWILGYAAIAAVLFFWLLPQKRRDWWKSSLQPLHLPAGEKNPWSRGNDGYFDQKKAYRNFAIYVGGPIVMGTGIQFFWPGSLFIVAGLFGIFGLLVKQAIRKDIEVLEKNKVAQISTLAKIQRDPDNARAYLGRPDIKPGKVWVFGTFYDFGEPLAVPIPPNGVWDQAVYNAEEQRVTDIMLPRLVHLARTVGPDKWFTLGRSKLV
jgi:hypothetical protein